MNKQSCCGEVIESSLQLFLTHCWQWNTPPPFGSLIAADMGTRTVYAIVHEIQTGSNDPIRHPFPYKKTHEELMQEQPQIFEFLKTTFSSATTGYREQGIMRYALPLEPPTIHTMVRLASTEECLLFFASNHYITMLFSGINNFFNIDELLLAVFRYQSHLSIFTMARFEQSIALYSLLTGNDYRRLKILVGRAQNLLPQTL